MTIESLLARIRADSPSRNGDPHRADTPDTSSNFQGYQRQPYGQAACTPDTPDTSQNTSRVKADCRPAALAFSSVPNRPLPKSGVSRVSGVQPCAGAASSRYPSETVEVSQVSDSPSWLASVAAHLDITPVALLAAGMIRTDEVPHYRDRAPEAFAAEIRITHPGRFPERAPDDRRHCRMCQHLSGYRCRERRLFVMDDLPRRCFDYRPTAGDPDQRAGRERWRELLDDPHSGQTAAQSEGEHDG